jgi:hypothetical protein
MAPACNSRCPSHQSHVARSRTRPACPEGPRGSTGILPRRRTRWSTMAAGSLLFLPLSALVAPRSYDERPTRMMRGVAGLSFILPWRDIRAGATDSADPIWSLLRQQRGSQRSR